MNQLIFKEVNPYNPLGQEIDDEASKKNIEALTMKKLNVELLLEVLIAILYEMTPNECAKSLKEHNVRVNL